MAAGAVIPWRDIEKPPRCLIISNWGRETQGRLVPDVRLLSYPNFQRLSTPAPKRWGVIMSHTDEEQSSIFSGSKCSVCGAWLPNRKTRYCPSCRPAPNERQVAWRKAQWEKVLDHYGARCACCGESNPLFLSVDHVNNDGAEHRASIGQQASPSRVRKWIIEHGFPDGFQILCFNCNLGKARNGGVCPHQAEASEAKGAAL